MKDTHSDTEDQTGEFRPVKNASFVLKIDTEVDAPSIRDAYTNVNAPRQRAKVNYTALRKQLALFEDSQNFNHTPSMRIK